MHEQLQAIHNTHEDLTGMQEQPRAIQNTKKHSMVEPTEVCTVPSKLSHPKVSFHEKVMNSQMAKADKHDFYTAYGPFYHGQCKQLYLFGIHACGFHNMLMDAAQVAGMQEQLRAIQDSHENLIGDSQRWRSPFLGSQAPADSDPQACSENVDCLHARAASKSGRAHLRR